MINYGMREEKLENINYIGAVYYVNCSD